MRERQRTESANAVQAGRIDEAAIADEDRHPLTNGHDLTFAEIGFELDKQFV